MVAPAARDVGDKRVERLLDQRVESGCRLVEHEQVGFVHERLHEADLLAVALGERADRPVERQLEPGRVLLGPAQPAQAAQMREVAAELARGQPFVEAKVSRQVADPPPEGDVAARVCAEDFDAARGSAGSGRG